MVSLTRLIYALLLCATLAAQPASAGPIADSTNVGAASLSGSVCATVDGIPADGSNGTPAAGTPLRLHYDGGNWFGSLSAAAIQFQRPLTQTGTGSCISTCNSNAAWNGSACACNTGFSLMAGVCQPPVTCVAASANAALACPANYSGSAYTTYTTSCPGGSWGAPVYSSSQNTSGCMLNPKTCTPSSSTVASACPAGYSGTVYTTRTNSCPAGPYGASVYSSSQNTSGCMLNPKTCTASSSVVASACPSGYSGTVYTTHTNSCPAGPYGASAYSGWQNFSGCRPSAVTCTPYVAPAVCPSTNVPAVRVSVTSCPSGSYGAPVYSFKFVAVNGRKCFPGDYGR